MAKITEDHEKIKSLIRELKKDGRESLYDVNHNDYRNNYKKQKLWVEVAEVMQTHKSACQSLWRNLRSKYKLALAKQNGKNGKCSSLKPMAKFLLREMEFFRKYLEDEEEEEDEDEPIITNFKEECNTESFQDIYGDGDMAADDSNVERENEVVQPIMIMHASDAAESEDGEEFLEEIAAPSRNSDEHSATIKHVRIKLDPYFLTLQNELSKVPVNKQNSLKLKMLALVFDAQESFF